MKPDEIVGKREPEPAEAEQHTGIDIDAPSKRWELRATTDAVRHDAILDMIQPIGLNDIYISVNILRQSLGVSGGNRWPAARLTLENLERCGPSNITEKRVPGLTAVAEPFKLIVLGKQEEVNYFFEVFSNSIAA